MTRGKDIAYFSMGYHNAVYKPIEDMEEYELNTRLAKLNLLLGILYKSKLLNVSKLSISRAHINEKDIDMSFEYPSNSELIYSEVYNIIKSVPNTGIIRLDGFTMLFLEKDTKELFDNCLSIYYSLRDESIEINITSDPWVPRDLEGKLQIALAELNAPRLYSCLEEIVLKLNYEHFYPNHDEEDMDSELPQKGFQIYIGEDITQRPDFPSDKKDSVQKYLWKNR